MVNIVRPAAGAVASYTSCGFTATDFNSLANGSVAVMPAAASIDNTVNLDDYIDVSFSFANGATTTISASFFALYLLPLNQDGSTYGDGSTTGTNAPAVSYWMTNAFVRNGIVSAGTLTGTFPTIWLPRKRFILAIANMTLGPLNAAAAAAVQYNTTNLNANG